MANPNISGSGPNSQATLQNIHLGQKYFQKDTATAHSQVQLMQDRLTNLGYNTKGADGKFGDNTLAAVKAFQSANGLTADGKFGRLSPEKLEYWLGGHLDPVQGGCVGGGTPPTTGNDTFDSSVPEDKYKVLTSSCERVNNYSTALSRINNYIGSSGVIVTQYFQELDRIARDTSTTYNTHDCAGFLYAARGKVGYKGSTSNLCLDSIYMGYIADLGGYNNLIPGMEIHQGCRHRTQSSKYYSSHVGVYFGKYDFGDGKGLQHAVYQSGPSYSVLKRKYNKPGGPELTSMNSNWNYWSWNRYVTR